MWFGSRGGPSCRTHAGAYYDVHRRQARIADVSGRQTVTSNIESLPLTHKASEPPDTWNTVESTTDIPSV